MFYKPEGKKTITIFTVGLMIVLILTVILSSFYVSILKSSLDSETGKYLSEICSHVSSMVEYRVNSVFQSMVSTEAGLNFSFQDSMTEEKANYLKEEAERYHFIQFIVLDENGFGISTNGDSNQYSDQYFFQNAIKGNHTVSKPFLSSEEIQPIMAYSVPIYHKDEIIGVLAAITTIDVMQSFLNVESFGGEGFSYILDSSGNYIIQSQNESNSPEIENFYSLLINNGEYDKAELKQMQLNLKEHKAGVITFQLENSLQYIANYIPLFVEDWYVMSIVPTSITANTVSMLMHYSILGVVLIITLLITLTIVLIIVKQRSRKETEKLAFLDPITGGSTALLFELEVQKLLPTKNPSYYSIVLMDIDKFKLINDSFGSIKGNATLKYIYQVITRNLYEGELAARNTADKFFLLLKTCEKDKFVDRLEAMVEDINSFNITRVNPYFISFSVGIYLIDEPNLDYFTIQDRANVAKKSINIQRGLNLCSYVFYSDLERVQLQIEKEMENRMDTALANREFIVYYQPKYELVNDTIVGAEALVRWNHPNSGIIPPSEFIPVFEKNGFIVKLDLFVFEEVCSKIKEWSSKGATLFPISVNLSRVHLYNPKFIQGFLAIQEKYGVPSHLIEIELTESLVFENMEMQLLVIEQIHNAGFTCSLDDFGSGYSSLNLLKDVPVDVLKLDRAFFLETTAAMSSRGKHIIESIVDLAGKLEIKIVSEGVETKEQVEFLREINCDMVQGYYFSKPLPVEEFEKHISF